VPGPGRIDARRQGLQVCQHGVSRWRRHGRRKELQLLRADAGEATRRRQGASRVGHGPGVVASKRDGRNQEQRVPGSEGPRPARASRRRAASADC
jgi:hypothetical protein